MSHEQELRQLREEALQLQQQLNELNRRLDVFVATSPVPPPPVMGEPPLILEEPTVAQSPPVIAPPVISSLPSASMEVQLGTFWLPRIGMALLLMGMVFLVTWTYRYMGPVGKVALSYACCVVLGGLGWRLEQRMPAFAHILQAGALALAYFVTYATHYVEAFRVVQNTTLALTLLSVVVAAIVWVSDRRKSATLAGLALFFGYWTTVLSGVAAFTLTANALLAVAAWMFLARNRWVPLALGATLATYLVYVIWVWRISTPQELGHLVFASGYLDDTAFRLRAAFLLLYWALFTVGGLIVRRDALLPAERTGLVTLNNALFFVLFSFLLHHAYPGRQWQFQFLFGGALLVTSALAYQRHRPQRQLMDALFLQGLAVATVGLIHHLHGVSLVTALALESWLVLWLARLMESPWVGWLGKATFGLAAGYAWNQWPGWDSPMIWGTVCCVGIGYVCARMVTRPRETAATPGFSAAYFALVSTILLLLVVHEQSSRSARPWGWLAAALIVAAIGVLLRTRETLWLSNVPLAWAHLGFHAARIGVLPQPWTLDQSLALVTVTLGFGLAVWAQSRADKPEADHSATHAALWPFALAAVVALLLTTLDYAPKRWLLTFFAAEAVVLSAASIEVLGRLALAPALVGTVVFLGARSLSLGSAFEAWTNVLVGVGLLMIAGQWGLESRLLWRRVGMAFCVTVVMLAGADTLLVNGLLTVGWAVCGLVLLVLGFLLRERLFRVAGLLTLALAIGRALFHDLSNVEMIYRILSFLTLGLILLALAYFYAKNRKKITPWL